MQYRWEEIDQLAEILEAEAAGHSIDHERARHLAQRLCELCPDIARTMSRVIERASGLAARAA
ncbi:hypothetical protein A6A04_06715 [Paramagnetospirillum marisnigri]|uniref:Uncharacterized protein n=1 Tax=Paramagnetospirillum marisnigri TaxID=1285242 RepID=A0A178MCJ8_9PROT|nr:hypothetical protein [Paramagnetospirillum marisnigri]OAN45584.1 hypothetical protein A6A04_06715 [Paramagnetospirillum marisnigri]